MKINQERILAVVGIGMCGVLGWAWAEQDRAKESTHTQVVAVAEDLGCKYIEQSYHHPENYYIDCGDDNIRIITLEK